MKKIFLLIFTVFALQACTLDEPETPNFYPVLLPVHSVDMPQEFILGQTYTIKVSYYKPSTCHSFINFYVEKYLNERIIAVENYVTERNDCVALEYELVEESFDFYVTNNGTYIFKFWLGGESTSGISSEDNYYVVEVPVY